MAAGEVLLSGTQLGTTGASGFPLSNLLDGNPLSSWNTVGGASQPWAGIDAGALCAITRVNLSPLGGSEDWPIGAQIQAGTTATFSGPQGAILSHASGSVGSIPGAFTNPNALGSCLFLAITWTNAATISSVVDTNGNAWALVNNQNDTTNSLYQSIYVAPNCAAGANTVTVTFSASTVTYIAGVIWEQPGVVSATPADGNNKAFLAAGSTSANTGNFTTTQAGDVILSFCLSGQSAGLTAGSGFTSVLSGTVGGNSLLLEQQVAGAAGTYAGTATSPTSATWLITAVALKPSGSGFGSPPTTLATIGSRTLTGRLLNQYNITPGQSYRYYRYLSAAGSFGNIADLDFYATYVAGVVGAAVDPIISPWGGNYDQPTRVRLSSTTTDAAIYYTLDGSTPTTSSTPYSGPFVVSSTAVVNAIAASSGLSNSRVISAKFYIAPNSIISTDVPPLDLNRGYRVWGLNPTLMKDPNSGYWYMSSQNVDQPGVVTSGWIGNTIYRSPDLRNWQFRAMIDGPPAGQAKNYATYTGRTHCLYNASNNNYVLWKQGGTNMYSYTSSSPEGPWTNVGTYTTLLGSSGLNGGYFPWVDPTSGIGYLVFSDTGLNNIYFSTLNSAYTNVITTAGTFNEYAETTTFGIHLDGFCVFVRRGVYFFLANQPTNWAPNQASYWTSSSPLGPWTAGGNPFQSVANSPYSPYRDNMLAYNSQPLVCMQWPGRSDNEFVYWGDAYNTGLAGTVGSSTTANFEAYTTVILPVTFPSGSTMSISWNPDWNLDSVLPTVSGAPAAATSLSVSGQNLSWTNNEPNPYALYLDRASDSGFTQNVASEVLSQGTASFTDTLATGNGPYYYRVRAVNASGTSVSNVAASSGNSLGSLCGGFVV